LVIVFADDARSELSQLLVERGISPVDVVNPADHGLALREQTRNDQAGPRPNVWRRDWGSRQPRVTSDDGVVTIGANFST
jgi:hypothetical protein